MVLGYAALGVLGVLSFFCSRPAPAVALQDDGYFATSAFNIRGKPKHIPYLDSDPEDQVLSAAGRFTASMFGFVSESRRLCCSWPAPAHAPGAPEAGLSGPPAPPGQRTRRGFCVVFTK